MFTDRAFTLKNKFGFTFVNDAANVVRITGVKRIPEMHVGHVTVRNYRVVVTPGKSMANMEYDCQQIVGCIGSDFVTKCRAVKIDIEKGIMVITDRPGFFDQEEGFRFSFREDNRVPYFQLSTRADQSQWCMFDTPKTPSPSSTIRPPSTRPNASNAASAPRRAPTPPSSCNIVPV